MRYKHMKRGFTLIELLVAIALFSIIIAIAAGGFTNALRTQREVAALISAQSNAGLAIEQMAREIRTGYLFCHDAAGVVTCTCPGGVGGIGSTWTCTDLNFYNAESANIAYSIPAGGGALSRSDSSVSGGAQPITSSNVIVRYLTFTLFGNLEGDHWNPRITISMGVSPNSTDPAVANNVLNLQTSVSAREIDCSSAGGPGAC